jgi:hypothetical protein
MTTKFDDLLEKTIAGINELKKQTITGAYIYASNNTLFVSQAKNQAAGSKIILKLNSEDIQNGLTDKQWTKILGKIRQIYTPQERPAKRDKPLL